MTRKDATLVGIGEERIGWMQHTPQGILKLYRLRSSRLFTASFDSLDWQLVGVGVLAGIVASAIFAFFVLLLTLPAVPS